jgi:hypothetical protein
MLVVCLVQPFLQGIKDHTICSLSLPISSWMRYRDILNNYASIIAEVSKIITGEHGPQISNDAVRQAKAMDNFIEQLSCFLRSP